MQPVTIVAATATHFTYLGDRFPRNMVVYPGNNDDAKLVDPAGREYPVPLGSTVGGSVPADQEALIDALVPIVSSGNSSGGATASEIDTALKASAQPVTLPSSTGSILSLTTSATGATFVAFASAVCKVLDIVNLTGVDIEYRRGGAGATVRIPDGTGREVYGVANANEISVRRVDQSNTQVTLSAEVLT